LEVIQQQLPCAVADFPCKYLGLQLTLKKLKKENIQPMIDRMANQLPGWKVDLLTRAGRKVYAICAHLNVNLFCHGFGSPSVGSQVI
jgi:hypothetical protein